jgi:hypothetical protein
VIWQHCGRLHDHIEHDYVARQAIVVEVCKCEAQFCVCPPEVIPRFRAKKKMRCPGRQVRSVEVPVTVEVKA